MFSRLRELYLMWEELARKGLGIGKAFSENIAEALKGRGFPSKAIVLGIGGSGIVGDFLRLLSLYYDFPLEVFSVRTLSNVRLDERAMLIPISYSGDTVEVIEQTRAALRIAKLVIGVTRGGLLEGVLTAEGLPLIKLPGGYPSRVAFPLMFYSVLALLSSLGLTGRLGMGDIEKSINVFGDRKSISRDAVNCAEYVDWRDAFVTTHSEYMPVALRLKNELAENSKLFVHLEEFPEWAHNTIEAIGQRGLSVVFVKGGLTHRYSCLLDAVQSAMGRAFHELGLRGDNLLEEYVYGAWLSGLVSIELAERGSVSPEETPILRAYREKAVNCSRATASR